MRGNVCSRSQIGAGRYGGNVWCGERKIRARRPSWGEIQTYEFGELSSEMRALSFSPPHKQTLERCMSCPRACLPGQVNCTAAQVLDIEERGIIKYIEWRDVQVGM